MAELFRRRFLACVTAATIALGGQPAYGGDDAAAVESRGGLYTLRWSSELRPLTINRMHSWILSIENADGDAVDDAQITVTGGMPLHDHGLPTAPRVTENLGGGRYRLGGIRFHMPGVWQFVITVSDGTVSDSVTLDFDVAP